MDKRTKRTGLFGFLIRWCVLVVLIVARGVLGGFMYAQAKRTVQRGHGVKLQHDAAHQHDSVPADVCPCASAKPYRVCVQFVQGKSWLL